MLLWRRRPLAPCGMRSCLPLHRLGQTFRLQRRTWIRSCPKLSERQLFFLILCHSTCGDPAGPMRCNVPLRNSKAFVETFSCQPGTPMHATHMCPVFR
ncbi:hypothetical protein MRX96_012346 [Rhipicephalus microplus]